MLVKVGAKPLKRKTGTKPTTADTKLIAMNTKYVLDPMFCMPTGHVCAAMIEPIEPPDAARFRPRARRLVGKICFG